MRSLKHLITAAAVMALAASTSEAQPQGGRRPVSFGLPPIQLLDQKSVQDELKLSDDQLKTVKDVIRKQREVRQGLSELEPEEREKKIAEMQKESDKAIAGLLKSEQAKRLKQIHLQEQGAQAFEKPEIVKELNITDDQKEKIKELREATEKELRSGNRPGAPDRSEVRRKMQEMNKATGGKIAGTLLTPDQKTKWKEMCGEPFKGEIRMTGGGRPGGG